MILFLSILWFMLFANLPVSLNGMEFKPFNTAGEVDRAIKLGAIAVGFAVLVANAALVKRYFKCFNPGLVAFVALALMSTLWSIDPNSTLLRFITLAAIVFVSIGISLAGWDRRRFQQAVAPAVMIILLVSIVVGILHPDKISEMGDDLSQKNAWHGITQTKNQFGMIASIGVVLYFSKWLSKDGNSVWSIAGTVISFICLALSRSNTSMFATLLALAFILLVRAPRIGRRYSTYMVVGVASLIFAYQLVIQGAIPGASILLEPIAALTGKDMTFSNRTAIWEIVKENIRLSPYVGSGYAAYWAPTPASPSNVFLYRMHFWPSESHNGYLEVMNDLGWAGIACLLLYLIWYMRQALQLMRFDQSQGAMYMGLLILQLVMNMSESDWFARGNTCVILLLASACMARAVLEERIARSGAAPMSIKSDGARAQQAPSRSSGPTRAGPSSPYKRPLS